jgi:hypothetical protein
MAAALRTFIPKTSLNLSALHIIASFTPPTVSPIRLLDCLWAVFFVCIFEKIWAGALKAMRALRAAHHGRATKRPASKIPSPKPAHDQVYVGKNGIMVMKIRMSYITP